VPGWAEGLTASDQPRFELDALEVGATVADVDDAYESDLAKELNKCRYTYVLVLSIAD
jgi:hypothetical protein